MGGRTIAACACALALPAPAAFAQERPDPDSPAGVEYELPLEGARRDASGGGESGAGRKGTEQAKDTPAPLFGEGISRSSASEREDAKADSGPAGSGGGSGGSGGSGGAANPGEATAPARLAAATSDEGGDTTVVVGGIAAGVLLSGGLLGLFLRRGFGRADPS